MGLSEHNTDRPEEHNIPEDLGGAYRGQESSFSSGPGHAQEPDIGSESIEFPGNQWYVEVVPGQPSDAANRMSCAFDLLLAAAARPR